MVSVALVLHTKMRTFFGKYGFQELDILHSARVLVQNDQSYSPSACPTLESVKIHRVSKFEEREGQQLHRPVDQSSAIVFQPFEGDAFLW